MLKETITYTDFDGIERTESFYFNLTKAELMNMQSGTDGGLAEKLEEMVAKKDTKAIRDTFEWIIHKAYGVKSDDGRRIMKRPELLQEFIETEAYSEIYMKLISDSEYAANFIKKIIPADLAKDVNLKALPE